MSLHAGSGGGRAMAVRVIRFQATPNPNALKCILDRSLGAHPRSYFEPPEVATDPVGAALFAIEGVTNVLINADWATVCKRPDADWGPIRTGVERVMADVEV